MSGRVVDDKGIGADSVKVLESVHSYERGVRHEFGYGLPWDLSRAAECFTRASECGLSAGHYRLGRCHEYGLGVVRDLGRALWHYRAGAALGHGESSVSLGRFLLHGIACDRDVHESRVCFESAVRAEVASGHRWLAVCLSQGVSGDLSSAREQYLRGALCGDTISQARLGLWCLYGIGGKLDLSEGLGWCEEAARGGDVESQFLAGMCLLEGLGTVLEERRGLRWLETAAASGHGVALELLCGRGVATGGMGLLLKSLARETLAGVAFLQATEQAKVDVGAGIAKARKDAEQALEQWQAGEEERTRLAVEAASDACKKSAAEDLEVWKMLEEERTSAAVRSAVEAQRRESDAALNDWKSGEARRIQAAVDKALSEHKLKAVSSEGDQSADAAQRLKEAVAQAVEKSEQASSAVLAEWKSGEAERTRQAVAQAVEASRRDWEKTQSSRSEQGDSVVSVTVTPVASSEPDVQPSDPSKHNEQDSVAESSAAVESEEYAVLDSDSEVKSPKAEVSDVSGVETVSEAGVLYRQGVELRASGDWTGSLSCFREGAHLGDASCKCALGECYERGEGCDRNDEKAAALYRESADLGNPRAKLLIGRYEFSAPVEGGGGSELDNFSVHGLGMQMIWCQRGTFQMGSPKGWFGGSTEKGRNDNEVRHQVTLSNGFWLGKYQVLQREYVMLAGACKLPSHPSQFTGETLPVDTVSWEDCQVWCEELTRRERDAGRLPDHYAYRLPTEAEWEYACRAGSLAAFNDGQNMLRDDGVCESLQKLGWFRDNSNELTHDVGLLKGNAWGFHDMHGNVSEWCYDKYEEYGTGAFTDPLAGFTGRRGDTGLRRVRRGGSWQDSARDCRCASRSQGSMNFRRPFIGFRIALGRELPSWRS